MWVGRVFLERAADDSLLPSQRIRGQGFAEMGSGSEEGSYLRLIDVCIY